MRATHVININSGAVCVRTSACDEHPMILRPIDMETVRAIRSGAVSASEVIGAITKAEMSKEGFDWKAYDTKRRAAEDRFNVSKREMIPVKDEDDKPDEKQDDNIVSFKDLGLGAKDEGKPSNAGGAKEGRDAKSKPSSRDSDLDALLGK